MIIELGMILTGIGLLQKSVRSPVLTLQFPLKGYDLSKVFSEIISSSTAKYGDRINPVTGEYHFHPGIDKGAPQGTYVYPVANGTVSETKYDDINGYFVKVRHGWGTSSYVHLLGYAVKPGDKVSTNTPFAQVGNTGRSTGPHIHLTLRDILGRHFDPLGGKIRWT